MARASTLEQVKDGYERWYGSGPAALTADPGSDPPWYRWARGVLQDVKGLRVLEIACGTGILVSWLAERGAHVVGCDISEQALGRARARGTGEYAGCDIHRLPFRDQEFDVVVCCETLEHTLDPDAALRELRRVAKPGASLLLTTPSYLNSYGLYWIYLWLRGRTYGAAGVQPIDHAFFSVAVARRVRRCGFRIRSSEGFGYYLLPARKRLEFIERSPRFRRWLKHFALHFAIEAEVNKQV